MLTVLKGSWALFLGMLLLMLGNGLQGTLLGVRGAIEGFSPFSMSIVMAGYFVGFLGGSHLAPQLIRRVGHVRVFAALASTSSACLLLYAIIPLPVAWFILRVIVGFCFSAVYVVAESWLNNTATNETRGKTLSIYLIVQMLGIVVSQGMLNVAAPEGFVLFIIGSVVMSLSFAPILLSVQPAPAFQTTKPMGLKKLFNISPLGSVGAFLLGGIFAAMFGMASVFGTEKGMSVVSISIFTSSIYMGGMLAQYPIGWMSDRMDRRQLIVAILVVGMVVCSFGALIGSSLFLLCSVAFVIGGVSNPLYSLYIAYTNDFLEHEDMAAASGGLIFINGLGAIVGPLIVGWMMSEFGANSFFIYIAVLMGVSAAYALYRMTQRASVAVEDTSSYAPISPSSSPVAADMAQEFAIEQAIEEEEEAEQRALEEEARRLAEQEQARLMAQEAKAEKKAQKKKKQDEEDEAHAKAVAAMSKNWF